MIITAVSHVGDFLRSIPALWSRYQATNDCYTFMFTNNYQPYKVIEPLLRLQPFTKDIVYIDSGVNAFHKSDYMVNPSLYGYTNEDYVNLSLDFLWNRPFAEHYGELIGGYEPDYSFTYTLPQHEERHLKYAGLTVGIPDNNKGDKWLEYVPATINLNLLSVNDTLIDNILFAKHAESIHTPSNLFSHVLEFCNVSNMTIYFHSSINTNLLHHKQNIIQFS